MDNFGRPIINFLEKMISNTVNHCPMVSSNKDFSPPSCITSKTPTATF